MSLFGTLDTFALPDVLRLMAATSKTGRLDVDLTGASGPSALWLVDGGVAGVAAPGEHPSPPSVDVLFEMLRRPEGTFSFEADGSCAIEGQVTAVEELLAGAAELLAEWRQIEAVVPSLEARVDLRGELVAEQVTVTAEQWRLLVGVGGGTTVGALGAARSLGELAVSRAVKELVEAGLVDVGPVRSTPDVGDDALAAGELPPRFGHAPFTLTSDTGAAASDGTWERDPGAGTPALRVVREEDGTGSPDEGAPASGPATDLLAASLGELAGTSPLPTGTAPDEDEDTADVARRLSALGPDAAAAVAAAADAATPEERDAALDAIDAEVPGQAVNRSALLKFLSTVRT